MNKIRNLFGLLWLMLIVLVLLMSIWAQPPLLHSVSGTIYNDSGTNQVPLGTSFSINNTVSTDYLKTQTKIPVPVLSGRYDESVNGTDGELVTVYAWNTTHYGGTNVTLQQDTTGVDVYLNLTRPSEPNISILVPTNNSVYNTSTTFNITANVSIIGSNAVQCNATISFSNASFINVTSGDTNVHTIGDINRLSSNATTWNVTANSTGTSNVTVSSVCFNQTIRLENVDITRISNLTVVDGIDPLINLISPANNTLSGTSNVTFSYNVSDHSDISECSLILNDAINLTNTSIIVQDLAENFTQLLEDGLYNWTVNCTDVFNNQGTTGFFNLSVNTSGPSVTNLAVSTPIILTAGTTAFATCNATLTPTSQEVNISTVNATLFDTLASSNDAINDNNDHYANASCTNLTFTGDAENYTCSFELWYYANNASWTCQVNGKDTSNQTGFGTVLTTVNELLALNTTGTIDYGELEATNISQDRNITIFNLGNVDMNISARGYGIVDGDNLSMTCGVDGNITVDKQRHSAFNGSLFNEMTQLTNQSTAILNITIIQRTDDTSHSNDTNETFWKIEVPTSIGGSCNGTIVLTATAAN